MSFVASLFLVAGILTLLHVGVAVKMQSNDAVSSFHRTKFPLILENSVSPEQKQMFLQALLALPHIQEAGTRIAVAESATEQSLPADGVEIILRSFEDFDTVFAFLLRPELQGILVRSDLLALPSLRESIEGRILNERQRGNFALFVSLGSLVLLALFLSISIGSQRTMQEFRLLSLFGANRLTVLAPCMCAGARMLLPAFFLSLFGAGIVLLSLGIALPSGAVLIVMSFVEILVLAVLLFCLALFVSRVNLRTGSV